MIIIMIDQSLKAVRPLYSNFFMLYHEVLPVSSHGETAELRACRWSSSFSLFMLEGRNVNLLGARMSMVCHMQRCASRVAHAS
jgi:hypothetical protein